MISRHYILLSVTVLTFCGNLPAVEAEASQGLAHYFDEENSRYLTLDRSEEPAVKVEVRFTGDPGYPFRWLGKGTIEERAIRFSRILGEDEAKGAEFAATVSSSRALVDFSPDQIEPGDEGINGEYRRVSGEKRLSLVKRELKAADEALARALRNLGNAREPGVIEWKRRWPDLRSRVAGLRFPSPAPPPSDGSAPTVTAPPESLPEYWILLIETTGSAISFANQSFPDASIPTDGTGDYDDGFGGRVALRARDDGSYRLGFSWQRGDLEAMGSDLSVDLPGDKVVKDAEGSWNATFTHDDPEAQPGKSPALFHVRKAGLLLIIEAENVERYTGKAWIDGVYRWGPIPLEE